MPTLLSFAFARWLEGGRIVFSWLKSFGREKRHAPSAVVIDLPARDITPKRETEKRTAGVIPPGYPEPIHKTPKQQARMLLKYMLENEITGEHRPEDMKAFYIDMCIDEYLHIYHWNVVAKEFTKITTRKKVYRWIADEKGIKHRLRVYPVKGTVVHLRRVA